MCLKLEFGPDKRDCGGNTTESAFDANVSGIESLRQPQQNIGLTHN